MAINTSTPFHSLASLETADLHNDIYNLRSATSSPPPSSTAGSDIAIFTPTESLDGNLASIETPTQPNVSSNFGSDDIFSVHHGKILDFSTNYLEELTGSFTQTSSREIRHEYSRKDGFKEQHGTAENELNEFNIIKERIASKEEVPRMDMLGEDNARLQAYFPKELRGISSTEENAQSRKAPDEFERIKEENFRLKKEMRGIDAIKEENAQLKEEVELCRLDDISRLNEFARLNEGLRRLAKLKAENVRHKGEMFEELRIIKEENAHLKKELYKLDIVKKEHALLKEKFELYRLNSRKRLNNQSSEELHVSNTAKEDNIRSQDEQIDLAQIKAEIARLKDGFESIELKNTKHLNVYLNKELRALTIENLRLRQSTAPLREELGIFQSLLGYAGKGWSGCTPGDLASGLKEAPLFDGKASELPVFISLCRTKLSDERFFSTERHKILYVLSRLRGRPGGLITFCALHCDEASTIPRKLNTVEQVFDCLKTYYGSPI